MQLTMLSESVSNVNNIIHRLRDVFRQMYESCIKPSRKRCITQFAVKTDPGNEPYPVFPGAVASIIGACGQRTVQRNPVNSFLVGSHIVIVYFHYFLGFS